MHIALDRTIEAVFDRNHTNARDRRIFARRFFQRADLADLTVEFGTTRNYISKVVSEQKDSILAAADEVRAQCTRLVEAG